MTRDEAIEIEKRKLTKVMSGPVNYIAAANIDALIELGLLKVDEPKSDRQKFEDALRARGMFKAERDASLACYDKVHK